MTYTQKDNNDRKGIGARIQEHWLENKKLTSEGKIVYDEWNSQVAQWSTYY